MFLKAVVVTLAVLAVTGSQADVSTDQVPDSFWNYYTALSSNARETVEQLQQADIIRQLRTLIQHKLQNVNLYAGDLQSQLLPFVTLLPAQLMHNSEKLKEQFQQEMEPLRLKIAPYADEVHKMLSRNVEELTPYAEELRIKMSEKAKDLKKALAWIITWICCV